MDVPTLPAVEDWGLTEYNAAFERQKALVERRIQNLAPDTLVFTVHKPVYTVGVRPGAERHLVWSDQERQARGIAVEHTNRGGDITYHGPGQIVGYPIIDLRARQDLHGYLRDLEQVLINALGALGLAAGRREGKTGIWLQERKIAAIGVAVRQWVTYHGFALNVDPDLAAFAGIVPCGIVETDGTVTSVKRELGAAPPLQEVQALLAKEFGEVFYAKEKVHA